MTKDINFAAIEQAYSRIIPFSSPSPVKHSLYLEASTDRNVFLKLENLLFTGSFKIRGAINSLSLADKKELSSGIVAVSAGNHAQAVAYASRLFKVSATVFMPTTTPLIKVENTRNLGASVVLTGDDFEEASQAAQEYLKEKGGCFLHAFSHPHVIAGQGTVGYEILDQLADVGMVIVPIGGGGLIGGVACAIKAKWPQCKIVGVQSEAFPAAYNSVQSKTLTSIRSARTIADGIAIKSPTELSFALIQKYVDQIVLVSEEEIAAAVLELMERSHILAEGAGAASVAALLSGRIDHLDQMERKKVVCVVSGGNIDMTLLSRIAQKGLLKSGRLTEIIVNIKDKPGSLAQLLDVLGKTGANIRETQHRRIFSNCNYDEVVVTVELETSSQQHQDEIFRVLKEKQYVFKQVAEE